ncbi:hypothetical protein SAMN06265365_108144 [Tistlia consotensis]|uniref:Uncharacterized protein n=1 Tax=Tistlia consotensis USBA 355 TaxID=560819 RepID=A0A1Y6BVW0_9PROT|nr:hypothetical protein [Tistlia consotensis]SMF23696.1 hypothetical protein SAMN05428998_10836 [Tistlia consotensis USBA 355]SNR61353.1 hypothetical protein SAMN06265365_108144 [Tistlia consotensis]
MLQIIAAVVLAGIGGTIANSVAVWQVLGADFVPLAVSPGRNGVAIAVAACLPFILPRVPGVWGWLFGLVVLTVVPSLLARWVFHFHAPWEHLLLLNGVYALAACLIYGAIVGRKGL